MRNEIPTSSDPDLPAIEDFMPLPSAITGRLRPDDHFLLSFPRSGSHWLAFMLALAVLGRQEHRGLPLQELLKLRYRFCFPLLKIDASQWRITDEPCDVFLWKTHAWNAIHVQRPSLLIFRRSEDSLVSWHRYAILRGVMESPNIDLETFVRGNLPWWLAHLEKAIEVARRSPLMLIAYETLHADPLPTLRRCLQHLGFDRDSDQLEWAFTATQPDQMRHAIPRLQVHRACPGDGQNWLTPETLHWIRTCSDPLYAQALSLTRSA